MHRQNCPYKRAENKLSGGLYMDGAEIWCEGVGGWGIVELVSRCPVVKAENDWRDVGRPRVAMHRHCHLS